MARSRYHWYTPYWGLAATWAVDNADSATWGQSVELINPDTNITDDLLQSSVRVTRIVGQYAWSFEGVESVDSGLNGRQWLHHRVYPVSGDGVNYFTRFLFEEQDADSDFMWHHIESPMTRIGTMPLVEQQRFNSMAPTQEVMVNSSARDLLVPPVSDLFMGRRGHVDIKVDRTIDEGQGLLWRTEWGDGNQGSRSLPWINSTVGTWDMNLYLWLRMLIKVYV